MYYTRLMGIAHCIVPQLLPIQSDPQTTLMQAPSMELLASMMKPNQQLTLGGHQMPSIVQIIIPAHSLQHVPVIDRLNSTDEVTTTSSTPASESVNDDSINETISTTVSSVTESTTTTIEPLKSSFAYTPTLLSTTTALPEPEPEKEDDIDDIQLNEDANSSDDYQENEDKNKKQRDRSDFRYVESFESERSPAIQRFDPDPNENDTELKNVINENYQQQQIPSVLPVPKALSSSKDTESEDHEPPEILQDENIGEPDM